MPNIFSNIPPPRELTEMPIRFAGMGIRDPTKTVSKNYTASHNMSYKLMCAILFDRYFDIEEHKKGVSVLEPSCSAAGPNPSHTGGGRRFADASAGGLCYRSWWQFRFTCSCSSSNLRLYFW